MARPIYKQKLAARRQDPISLISAHKDQKGLKFNPDNVKIPDQAIAMHEKF